MTTVVFIPVANWMSSLGFSFLAYIGPGSGLSVIAAVLAVVASIVISIIGFFWYPIKRLLGKGKQAQEPEPEMEEED